MDQWTSFVRTYDPNPDPSYLAVRGYTNSAELLGNQTRWVPVTNITMQTGPRRVLQKDSFMDSFRDVDRCEFLGFSLDFYG